MNRTSNEPMTPGAPPRAGEKGSQKLGRDFLFAFHAALRALKLYPLENRTVQKALQELHQQARALGEAESGVMLRYVGEFCFVNDLRLRIDLSSYATFGAVGRALRRHGIGFVEADAGATREEWTTVLSLLLTDPPEEGAFEAFAERLGATPVRNIEVRPVDERPPEPIEEDAREAAKKAYVESVAVARETMLGVRMGKGVSVRRVKRTVQKIVDQVLNNEVSIVGMTVLRDYDQYTFAHSVNVCIFSVALGKKLGLDKHQLYELGLGALMHDIGKVKMPIELTTKKGALADVEWEVMKEHPTEGLLALLEMASAGELPFRAVLLAYEHHMKMDLSGYPTCIRPREPTLFSRIVAVADGFDAGTSRRSYQSLPWTPDAVLREMRDNPTRGFDPLLVKAFVGMTGFYPVGSVVILDSFELAVVVAPSTRPDNFHQPVVKVVFDDLGLPVLPPRTLDLTEVDPETGAPLRTIIKTTDPERYGIDVKEYFV